VHWWVDLGPWSFVFNGLDRVLVSFPIENFWDAKSTQIVLRFSFWFPQDLVSGVTTDCNLL
jgi:hypothetical protein